MTEQQGCTTTMTEPAIKRASPRHVTPFAQAQRNFSPSFQGPSAAAGNSGLGPVAGLLNGGDAGYAADAAGTTGCAPEAAPCDTPAAGNPCQPAGQATVNGGTAAQGQMQDPNASPDTLPYDRITRLRIQSQRSPGGSSPPGNNSLLNPSAGGPSAAAAAPAPSNGVIITPFSMAQPAGKSGTAHPSPNPNPSPNPHPNPNGG